VFNGLKGGAARAADGQVGSELRYVGAYESVARDEAYEGGENGSVAALGTLDDWRKLACGRGRGGSVCESGGHCLANV
jgi:hypothetical protein